MKCTNSLKDKVYQNSNKGETDNLNRSISMKETESTINNQRTYIHNPWTQATVWGQPEGGGLGDRRRGINRVGGNEGICNSFNNKNKEKTNF